MSWFKDAFAVKPEEQAALTGEDHAILDKLAGKVHHYRMSVPAVIFLESVKPLNFVASQVMVFFKPFVSAFFTTKEYDRLTALLERRDTLELLLEKIENHEQHELKEQDAGTQNGS